MTKKYLKFRETKLRKIIFSYKELSYILGLPKEEFTLGLWGNELKIWKEDKKDLKDWEAIIPLKDLKELMYLLPNEEIVENKYEVFYGYSLIIKTNKQNLSLIKKRMCDYNNTKFIFGKIKNELSIYWRKWVRLALSNSSPPFRTSDRKSDFDKTVEEVLKIKVEDLK